MMRWCVRLLRNKRRFVALLENGTHVLFASRLGSYACGELKLGGGSNSASATGNAMFGRPWFHWRAVVEKAAATGAELLWRCKTRDEVRLCAPL